MVERFALPTAVHLLVLDGENVLMIRRANTGYEDGKYSVPAGHIDKGESAMSAMAREAHEEIGVTLQFEEMRFVLLQHKRDPVDGAERMDLFFACNLGNHTPQIMEPNMCDSLDWFQLASPPLNTIEYLLNAFEEIRLGRHYAEFGW